MQITLDDLRPEIVMETAAKATGLNDYGDLRFVEGLTVFMEDLRTNSKLHQAGIITQFQDAVRILSNRLIFQKDISEHPEILSEKIEKPIIIFGMTRTGTSNLQRMISADPDVQRLEMWRLLFPAPFPGTTAVKPDPRIAAAKQAEEMLINQYPEVMARHPMETCEPDEEWWLMEMSYESSMTSIKTYAPKHWQWLQQRSQRYTYEVMYSQLQYLQWQDGGACGRPWIMKSPAHLGELPLLLEFFPDASLVHCHRRPKEVIASFAALMEVTWLRNTDEINMYQLGHGFNEYWGEQIKKNIDARLNLELGEGDILDVYFEDICDNPEKIIYEIYARANRPVTKEARKAFADYAARRPKGFFGKYSSELERYGLSEADIEKSFKDYLDYFPRLKEQTE